MYKFSLLPVAALLPVLVALGLLIPLLAYKGLARESIVERIRAGE